MSKRASCVTVLTCSLLRPGADFFERFDRLDRAAGDEDGEAGPGGGAGGAAAGASAGRGAEGRDGAAPRKPGGGEEEEEDEGGEAEEEEAVFEEDDDYLQARAWFRRALHARAHAIAVLQRLALRHGCGSGMVAANMAAVGTLHQQDAPGIGSAHDAGTFSTGCFLGRS
jgi:hypothetical protein